MQTGKVRPSESQQVILPILVSPKKFSTPSILAAKLLFWMLTFAALASAAQAERSNILLVVADDMGYSDIGAFGSEIQSPSIDSLAAQGLRMTRFYTSSVCSPTRSMLLSGTDNHLAGLGAMRELNTKNQVGQPGYEGFLNHRVVSLAALMKDAGYHTYMAGKWHLGNEVAQTPTARGFERSFALLGGTSDHFDGMIGRNINEQRANYWQDGREVDALPKDFYSSDFYTSQILQYIDANINDGKPFLAYLSFTAPHTPLQAPEKSLQKYRGKYADGWDVIRAQRFDQAKTLGVISENATLPPRPSHVPAWNSLDPKMQAREARLMEVYAAMIDRMDYNVGRVINYLKQQGIYDNTYIVFFSDNGAAAFEYRNVPAFADWHKRFDNSFESIGRKGSYSIYGAGWAQAGEAPFRLTKGFATEGGIRSPAIIVDPARGSRGAINDSVVTVMDLLPTFLEIAETKLPGNRYNGREIHPPSGRSILPITREKKNSVHDSNAVFGMEMFNERAIIKGDWKLLRVGQPFGHGEWSLFDLSLDPGEQHDLARHRPRKLAELVHDWESYVIENQVILPEGPFIER